MTHALLALALATALAPIPPQDDAITASRFGITVDGYEIASFDAMGPLDLKAKSSALVLKKARSSSPQMWAWHEAARNGLSGRRSATLVAYGRDGKPVARYQLVNAWPSKIAGPTRKQLEAVTISYESIRPVR